MATKKKSLTESTEETVVNEEQIIEQPEEEIQEEQPKEEYIYVPEIPAQIIEPKQQTEVEFLGMILQIQEDGGFGRHLNKIILDRIKLIS